MPHQSTPNTYQSPKTTNWPMIILGILGVIIVIGIFFVIAVNKDVTKSDLSRRNISERGSSVLDPYLKNYEEEVILDSENDVEESVVEEWTVFSTIDLKANNQSVGQGGFIILSANQSLDLSWSSSLPSPSTASCSLSGWGSVPLNGLITYTPAHSQYPSASGKTYTLTCSSANVTISDSVTIALVSNATVNPDQTCIPPQWGIIVGGPTQFNGFTWWQIDYDGPTSCDGWSVEIGLMLDIPIPPSSVPPPTISTFTGDIKNAPFGFSRHSSGVLVYRAPDGMLSSHTAAELEYARYVVYSGLPVLAPGDPRLSLWTNEDGRIWFLSVGKPVLGGSGNAYTLSDNWNGYEVYTPTQCDPSFILANSGRSHVSCPDGSAGNFQIGSKVHVTRIVSPLTKTVYSSPSASTN